MDQMEMEMANRIAICLRLEVITIPEDSTFEKEMKYRNRFLREIESVYK